MDESELVDDFDIIIQAAHEVDINEPYRGYYFREPQGRPGSDPKTQADIKSKFFI